MKEIVGILSGEIETIRKNQVENIKVKNKLPKIKIHWMDLTGELR